MDIDELVERACEPVISEYALAFKGLADSVRAIPEQEWTRGDTLGDVPARQACHLLLACVAYSGGHRLRVGDRFGVRVETFHCIIPRENYPSREAVLKWIPEVEQQIARWVRDCTRRALTGPRKRHTRPGTRYSPMRKPVYVLRHTVVHLAYLRNEMRKRGIPRPGY
jgi:hypothetical protein